MTQIIMQPVMFASETIQADKVRSMKRKYGYFEEDAAIVIQNAWKAKLQHKTTAEHQIKCPKTLKQPNPILLQRFKFDIFVKHAVCKEFQNFKKHICFEEIRNCKEVIKGLLLDFASLFPVECAEFASQLEGKMFDHAEDLQHFSSEFSLLSAWDTCEPEIVTLGEFNTKSLGHELLLDSNFTPTRLTLQGCFTHSAVQLQLRFENHCFHEIFKELSGQHSLPVPYFYTYTKLYRMRQWLAQIVPLEFAKEKEEIILGFVIPTVFRNLITGKCHWSELVFLLEKNMDLIQLVNIPEDQKTFYLTEWEILKNAMIRSVSDLQWPCMVAHAIEWIYKSICSIHELCILEVTQQMKPKVEVSGVQYEQQCYKDNVLFGILSNKVLTADISKFVEERFTNHEKTMLLRGRNTSIPRKCNVLLMVKYLFEPVPNNAKFKDILPDSLLLDLYNLLELRSTFRFLLLANNIMTKLSSFEKSIDNFNLVSFVLVHF